MEDDGRSGYFSTCNVAYRREVLDAVGGFDEAGFSYRRPGAQARRCINGEDTDLAWRAIEAGFRSAVADDALVEHDVFPSDYRAHLHSVPRLAGLVLLFKKHPQLRQHFGKSLVYRTEDVAAGAFFAGAAAFAVAGAQSASGGGAVTGLPDTRPAGAVFRCSVSAGTYGSSVSGRNRLASAEAVSRCPRACRRWLCRAGDALGVGSLSHAIALKLPARRSAGKIGK